MYAINKNGHSSETFGYEMKIPLIFKNPFQSQRIFKIIPIRLGKIYSASLS